jgi:GxxExxY protein
MEKLIDREEIAKNFVDAAYRVHCALGPGLLESAYQKCLIYELGKRGFQVKSEVILPVCYDGLVLDTGFRLDLLVEDSVVIENKAVEQLMPLHEAQLLTYLKLGGFQLGFLIYWNVKLIKHGIKRVVFNLPEPLWREQNKRGQVN